MLIALVAVLHWCCPGSLHWGCSRSLQWINTLLRHVIVVRARSMSGRLIEAKIKGCNPRCFHYEMSYVYKMSENSKKMPITISPTSRFLFFFFYIHCDIKHKKASNWRSSKQIITDWNKWHFLWVNSSINQPVVSKYCYRKIQNICNKQIK